MLRAEHAPRGPLACTPACYVVLGVACVVSLAVCVRSALRSPMRFAPCRDAACCRLVSSCAVTLRGHYKVWALMLRGVIAGVAPRLAVTDCDASRDRRRCAWVDVSPDLGSWRLGISVVHQKRGGAGLTHAVSPVDVAVPVRVAGSLRCSSPAESLDVLWATRQTVRETRSSSDTQPRLGVDRGEVDLNCRSVRPSAS